MICNVYNCCIFIKCKRKLLIAQVCSKIVDKWKNYRYIIIEYKITQSAVADICFFSTTQIGLVTHFEQILTPQSASYLTYYTLNHIRPPCYLTILLY